MSAGGPAASGTPNGRAIRRAVAADAPALAELRYAFRADQGDPPTEDRAAFLARVAAWMRPRLERQGDGGGWICWVAERDGAIVGNVWLQLLEKIPNPVAETEWHGYVSNFFVVPRERGGGLGSRMLGELVAEARRRELDRLVLWPTPPSRPLYERHGFAAPRSLLELPLR